MGQALSTATFAVAKEPDTPSWRLSIAIDVPRAAIYSDFALATAGTER
jgi:hypothetical protein